MEKSLALIGNPNTGKTSLFNSLTKSFEHVGNWHGVTVDSKSKKIKIDNNVLNIIDLPGLYSLSAYSFEENVSIDYIYKNKDAYIYNLCDANNLNRNLYLTLQLLEAKINPIVLVNFFNEVKKKGKFIDLVKLSEKLGIKFFSVDANNKKQVKQIVKQSLDLKFEHQINLPYLNKLPLSQIINVIKENAKLIDLDERYCAIKLLEQDEHLKQLLNLTDEQNKQIDNLTKIFDISIIAGLRYEYIDNLLKECIRQTEETVYGKYKIDKIILNKYFALPIFICILALIFFLTFSSVGAYLSQFIKTCINKYIGLPVNNLLINNDAPLWVIDLINGGIISGVGGLLSFLPQIVLLFLFLTVLEDSGYLSRLAFVLEDVFKKVGLNGKSVFTLLMGFGCATTAVITSRNLEDKNSKIKTAMITPYMSCSAKLPLYAVLGGCIFGATNIFVIIALYIIGVVVALVLSVALEQTILKSGAQSFMLEFAPYRLPNIKRVLYAIYENCKLFVIKVGSLLLSLNVIVWVLQSFSFNFTYIPSVVGQKSILQTIGEFIAPVFAPIGLNNWGIVASLIAGIIAKEMVVSSIAIINNVPTSVNFNAMVGATLLSSASVIHFDPLSAIVCMVFVLLYCPCLSTVGVMRKEIGRKYTWFAVILQFIIAYVLCFIIYSLGLLIINFGWLYIVLSVLGVALVLFSTIFLIKTLRKKNACAYCKNCNKKCNKFK